MNPVRVIGYLLLALGVILFLVGIEASGAFANGFAILFAPRLAHGTLDFLVSGIVCLATGGLLVVLGVRTSDV